MYRYVIFDLDGTLSDSEEGILNSIRHALSKLHIEEPGYEVLYDFLGPPLTVSLDKWFQLDEDKTKEVIRYFREYFEEKGITENHPYPGIPQLLRKLSDQGFFLAVASSKPEKYVKKVLVSSGIEDCFNLVVGADGDGESASKEAVLQRTVTLMQKSQGRACRPETILMVGDRKFDILAAKGMGITTAAVTYGYGSLQELTECEPVYLADDTDDLESIITGKPHWACQEKQPAIRKTLKVLTPLLVYWALQLAVYNLCYLAASKVLAPDIYMSDSMAVYLNAIASIAVWPYLAFCYKSAAPVDISAVSAKRKTDLIKKEWPLIVAYAMSLAMGLNLVFASLGVNRMSETYERVSGVQYSVALPVGLVVYGILTPFTEELMFRGVLQNRIKEYFPPQLTVFLSALIFGCYHGNPVQMLYAILMGLSLALAYHFYGRLSAPVLVHCSANILIYCLSKKAGIRPGAASLCVGSALLLLAAGVTVFYCRRLQMRKKQKGFR